jgi:hypothetical protein
MIPSSTIDFNVVEARQNGQSAVAGRVLFSFTSPAKIELDEPREVVPQTMMLSAACRSPNHPLQVGSMPQYFRGIFHSCMGTY